MTFPINALWLGTAYLISAGFLDGWPAVTHIVIGLAWHVIALWLESLPQYQYGQGRIWE